MIIQIIFFYQPIQLILNNSYIDPYNVKSFLNNINIDINVNEPQPNNLLIPYRMNNEQHQPIQKIIQTQSKNKNKDKQKEQYIKYNILNC